MIGAVANAFASQRPSDPRTAFLASVYLTNRKNSGSFIPSDTIVAQEIKLLKSPSRPRREPPEPLRGNISRQSGDS